MAYMAIFSQRPTTLRLQSWHSLNIVYLFVLQWAKLYGPVPNTVPIAVSSSIALCSLFCFPLGASSDNGPDSHLV